MTTLTAAERVRTRASWLATHAAIATVLTLAPGVVYYYVADEFVGVLLGLLLAALALASLVASLVGGFVANARRRERMEAKPIANVSKVARERGRD
ncbi:hypothetical protein [Halogranum rubrum]|uniref:Uncharacterized protein n=1 Tax=Halogranum salarium B-1 TaxID=1210908 RepID=J3JCY6_9EURY|nr:hypothetical protein [Halogranum salarium]EJN57019.1 hypothetical protein HSB1_44050 [Halogranum salarium B-1]